MLRADPSGRDELLLTQAAFARAFPNGEQFFADAGVLAVIQREDGRRTVTSVASEDDDLSDLPIIGKKRHKKGL